MLYGTLLLEVLKEEDWLIWWLWNIDALEYIPSLSITV